MTRNGCGRQQLLPTLKHKNAIFLEEMSKSKSEKPVSWSSFELRPSWIWSNSTQWTDICGVHSFTVQSVLRQVH